MAVIEIDDDLRSRFQAVAAPEDLSAFVAKAIRERIAWHEQREAAQAILNGPHRPAAEVDAEFRHRHNIPDLSHLTPDELAEKAERALSTMTPEARTRLEQAGLL